MERHPLDIALRHEVEAIFEAALELSSADRGRWLAERCGLNHQLRAEVDALIAAHERAEGMLEADIGDAAASALQQVNRGRRIGVYRVLREVGRGGMGVVYLAERDTDSTSREWPSSCSAPVPTPKSCAGAFSPSDRSSRRSSIVGSRSCSTAA